MFSDIYGAADRPKRLKAIVEHVFNNAPEPMDVSKYRYRQLFGLTAQELAVEPIDQFFTNLFIWGQIQEKNRINEKHGTS